MIPQTEGFRTHQPAEPTGSATASAHTDSEPYGLCCGCFRMLPESVQRDFSYGGGNYRLGPCCDFPHAALPYGSPSRRQQDAYEAGKAVAL